MFVGITSEVLGGGRIEFYNTGVSYCRVYGFSYAYGQANHHITAAVLQRTYPLHDIHVSFEGY